MTALMEFCIEPRSKKEMMDYLELTDSKHFRKKISDSIIGGGQDQDDNTR